MSVEYVKMPHLPEGRVGLLALGSRYRRQLERPLRLLGIEPLWLPENAPVDSRLAGHADLCLFHAGGKRIVCAGEALSIKFADLGYDVTPARRELGGIYPRDAALNGCLIGNRFIHNLRVSDPAVLDSLGQKITKIGVRQGYAKCSVCVVDAASIITSDMGIASAAEASGLSVLRIRPGGIELPGFQYGFIGGASFKLSAHELAFTGRLDAHPDMESIESFLRSRDVVPVFLTEGPAFDIGSAVPLAEAHTTG